MSLVNDALKRAKDAQRKGNAPAPGPQFRPAEPATPPAKGIGLIAPVAIGLVAIVGSILVLQNRQKTVARESAPQPKPTASVTTASAAKPAEVSVTVPAPVAVVAEKPVATPAPVVRTPEPALKLKAIFYSPGHSTAIINGKTVKAGDVYKGFRVAAITQTSATLVSATQTNVMTLEPD
jgi:MSHA biogenesis protein MshK